MTSRPPASRALRLFTFALLGSGLLAPAEAWAQTGCRFAEGSGDLRQVTLAGGRQLLYVGTPHLVCGDGVEIWADSAVAYVSDNWSHFIGDVRFRDPSRALTSDEARYFTRQGRLQAQGNLFVQDTVQGSIIENGDMVYLRQTEFRETEQITVRTWVDEVRPTALLYLKPAPPDSTEVEEGSLSEPEGTEEEGLPLPALRDSSSISIVPIDTVGVVEPVDSTGAVEVAEAVPEAPLDEEAREAAARAFAEMEGLEVEPAPPPAPDTTPYRVTGHEIFLQGDSYFRATGDVVIERDSINAYGQVAEYDQLAGRIFIQQQARVETGSYDLEGRDINIGLENGSMRDVRAIRDGVLTGDDLVLTAPSIRIYLFDGAMERLVAVPLEQDPDSALAGVPVDSTILARPLVVAEQFSLTADSLDVRAPGDVLERIIAVGTARGESRARDSLNVEVLPPVAQSDWLEGDTVIASFTEVLLVDTTSATGTRTEYRLSELLAKSEARSLYRMDPTDTTKAAGVDPPAVHYVMGDTILIVLDNGEVDHMDVHGRTRGYHLEPLTLRTDSLVADSLGADSAAVSDTTLPDTTGVRPDTTTDSTRPAPISDILESPSSNAPAASTRYDPFNRSRRPW